MPSRGQCCLPGHCSWHLKGVLTWRHKDNGQGCLEPSAEEVIGLGRDRPRDLFGTDGFLQRPILSAGPPFSLEIGKVGHFCACVTCHIYLENVLFCRLSCVLLFKSGTFLACLPGLSVSCLCSVDGWVQPLGADKGHPVLRCREN